jgi:AraC-like DNA-binding protein
MSNSLANTPVSPKSCLWDSHYGPSTAAFSAFRKFICTTFLPWSLERQCDDAFQGRAEGLILPAGAVAKTKSTPVTGVRGKAELENSRTECLYANFIISGELHVQQGSHDLTAKHGDLVVYDSCHPVVATKSGIGSFEDLSFRLDKRRLGPVEDVLISAEEMIAPLAACLVYLSENFLSIPLCDAAAWFDVFSFLLPVAALSVMKERAVPIRLNPPQKSAMRELLEHIEAHLGSPELSPRSAAAGLGISLRYVHKLFAEKGMTFGGYVTTKRLDYVRRDLSSEAFRQEPIYAVAARWGLDDPSAFNRIFKKRFGMTPGRMRTLRP